MGADQVAEREFTGIQNALERALADPLATGASARTAAECAERHGEACRRAMAAGGAARRAADHGRNRIRRQLVGTTLPAIDAYFTALAERSWKDDATLSREVSPPEVADLLRWLAVWERTVTTDSDANALVAKICSRMSRDARTWVERFKAQQTPTDSPDYRAISAALAALEDMTGLACRLDRPAAVREIALQRDHCAKSALLGALAVIERADDTADMFVHFDIAAMLVSVEHMVSVIARTIAVVDRERDQAHPHVESTSEHVVRDFASGLCRLAPSYRRMLQKSIATQQSAAPQFAFSILRVLVQLARLIRILHHLTGDDALAQAADRIAADIDAVREPLRARAADDPDLLSRVDEALDALGAVRAGT